MFELLDSGLMVARGSVSYGPLQGERGESGAEYEAQAKADMLPAIRKYAGASATIEDVHVFQGRIANTQLISFGGKFTPKSIQELVGLYAGKPVMFEHDYDQAPIGRIFSSRRDFVEDSKNRKDENYWATILGYLPANDPEGDAIYRRIKLGIFNEMSAAWAFMVMTCSICEEDMRRCGHWPLDIYDPGGLAYFDMEGVVAAYEGSIVFQGAAQGTTIDPVSASAGAGMSGARVQAFDSWRHRLAASYGSAQTVEQFFAEKKKAVGEAPDGDSLEAMFASVKNDAVLELEAARSASSEPNQPLREVRNLIVSIHCPKARFTKQEEAAAWAMWRNFRVDQADATSSDWVFTIRDRKGLEDAAVDRKVALERKRSDPVVAVVGTRKMAGGAAAASIQASDSLAALFGA